MICKGCWLCQRYAPVICHYLPEPPSDDKQHRLVWIDGNRVMYDSYETADEVSDIARMDDGTPIVWKHTNRDYEMIESPDGEVVSVSQFSPEKDAILKEGEE